MAPSVGVIVPCYNYGRYLSACVHSVLSQEDVDVDVLVIDDHSNDDTQRLCRQLSEADGRVRSIRHAHNWGHIATYNEGISLIRSDYLVILSADDILAPGSLSRATALMEAFPSVGLVYGHPVTVHDDVFPPARSAAVRWKIWPGSRWIRHMCRSGRNFIISPEAVIRTSIQRRLGGYRASLPHTADMEMWIRAAAISDVGRVNGPDQAYYRVHRHSMQRTVHSGFLRDIKGRYDAFASAFASEAGGLPHAPNLKFMAERALARTAIREAQSLLDGDHTTEGIDELCALAVQLFPRIVDTIQWRGLTKRRQHSRDLAQSAFGALRRIARKAHDQLAWRRWYYTGIH